MGKKSRARRDRKLSVLLFPSKKSLHQAIDATPPGVWRSVPGREIASALPKTYKEKLISPDIYRDSPGHEVLLILRRLDEVRGNYVIDHDPLILHTAAPSGLLEHHASFPGRTVPVPQQLVGPTNAKTRIIVRQAMTVPTSGYYRDATQIHSVMNELRDELRKHDGPMS